MTDVRLKEIHDTLRQLKLLLKPSPLEQDAEDAICDLVDSCEHQRTLTAPFLQRIIAANEICRCAPNYQCLRCSAQRLLEEI
jgi:hypothetical protein